MANQLALTALLGGLAATVVIGAVAGLYPAFRAARTPPAVALSSAQGAAASLTPGRHQPATEEGRVPCAY
ncbi:hypothetical protein ACFZAV_38775 [Streptomyces sp. NPDC008343]|uniref:hypothetical protein n=1 Tax=Streptomyces sp. NPDC008343 TaxID=3364828 RepID=UPI0036EE7980